MHDVLVIGAGPAGAAMAAALCQAGLRVLGLAPASPTARWPNTYGIWCDELGPLGLEDMLGHRWGDCLVYAGERAIPLGRDYGLFDNDRLQGHLLAQCERGAMQWQQGLAATIEHLPDGSRVTTRQGARLAARVVVDASGHKPAFVRRPAGGAVAYQAAYGIVGTFSRPPVAAGQLVLMDYRAGHLTPAERAEPPTFLYAMDLGQGRYFVEETSLAHAPAVPLSALERRLHRRLAAMGVAVEETQHIERCLFPMNTPIPYLDQPVVGFGGAASMVHPASGYQVGAALRRAPAVAQAIARALGAAGATPAQAARAAWQALWPAPQLRNHYLYRFGLASLLRFDVPQIHAFFHTFFHMPFPKWAGYLSDTLSTRELARTMLHLFGKAPNRVRAALVGTVTSDAHLLWRALIGQGA